MLDKARYGTRYVCFQCGTKFYDLNRPTPTCPECSADQREAPVRDMRSLLSKGGRKDHRDTDSDDLEDEDLDEEVGVDEDGDDDDDELGLLGDDDDDEGGGGEDLD